MSSRKGRPKRRHDDQPRRDVLSLIPEDGSEIRWIVLEGRATSLGMSLSTVYKYLGKLEKLGSIERRVDQKKRPPAVYYRRILRPLPKSIEKMITNAKTDFRKYLEEWAPNIREGFKGVDEMLATSLEKLHEIKPEEERAEQQARLFIIYGNIFLAFLSNLLEDYSCTTPPEDAEDFLDDAVNILVKPMLHGVAKIFSPELERDKYAMENMRDALAESLPRQLETFNAIRRVLAKRSRGAASKSR